MSIFSKLKSIYTSVDKAIGGVLPGGSPSVFKSTTTTKELSPTYVSKPSTSTPSPTPSTPTSSGGTSSGGTSSGGTKIRTGGSTYNPITKVYTDPYGVSSSTATPPKGATITLVPDIATIRRRSGYSSNVLRPYAQSTLSTQSLINQNLINQLGKKIEQTGVINRVKSVFNTVSGGVLTRKDIQNQQAKLNEDIGLFNKRYGNRELEESEYAKAQAKLIELQAKEKALELAQIKAEGNKVKKVWDFVLGNGALFVNYDFDKAKADAQKDLKKLESQRQKATSSFNKKRLDLLIKSKKEDIVKIENRQLPNVIAGTVPITPVGVSGIPKNLKVKFIGIQKQVGKNIITDIAFTSSKGEIGVAKGVTLVKGNKGYSIVGGRFGKSGIKFPSTKPTIKKIKTFIGVEKAITKPTTIKVTKQLNLLKNAKSSGQVIKITKNLKLLKQAGIGKVVTVKGQKILNTGIKFPSGKLIKIKPTSLTTDDFASISAILRRKDLSAIIGRTITAKGSKAKFIGLIKGIKGSPKTFNIKSGKELLQYKKALTKVITTVSGALAQSKKISGLTKAQQLAIATNIIKKSPTKLSKLPSTKLQSIKTKTLVQKAIPTTRGATAKIQPRDSHGRFISSTKTKSKAKTKLAQMPKVLQKQKLAQRTLQRTTQKTKQISKARTSQISAQRLRQLQKQKLAQRTLQRTTPRTILRSKITRTPTPKRIIVRPLPLVIRRSLQTTLPKIKRGKKTGYFLYEKVRGRYKKVKIPALSLNDAKNKLAYRLDNRISRTIRLVKVNVKKLGTIKSREKGYYNKFKRNLRNYKVVKGRKVKTPLIFIEKKGTPVISTKGEKIQLARTRRRSNIKISRRKYKGHTAKTQPRDSHGRFIKKRKKRESVKFSWLE